MSFDFTGRKIRLATRGSALALFQANAVSSIIRQHFPSIEVELVIVTTTADRQAERPLHEIGDKGMFVKEIEEAILAGQADAGVHSLKDLPGILYEGLRLSAVLPREDVRDVLLSREGQKLDELPAGAKVATSSLRRQSQLLHLRPDLRVVPVRGNVDTRLRKLREANFDAMIMAAAGLRRLKLDEAITQYLPVETMLPAAGQAAIGIEAPKYSDFDLVWDAINDPSTRTCVEAEREFTRRMGADCRTPVGCYCRLEQNHVQLRAMVCAANGSTCLVSRQTRLADIADEAARAAAEDLFARGAAAILASHT